MLDPDAVDLDELCLALDDRSPETEWFVHSEDGRVVPSTPEALTGIEETENFDDPVWRLVESTGSGAGYRDMADFVAGVHNRRAAELLDRAISGRGAFRRFKDTLVEFPDLRDAWFRFRDSRARRRALQWLADEGLIDAEAAERAMARHPDPAPDEEDVPAALHADLRMLLGHRLDQVLLTTFTDEHVEIIVVLRELDSPWEELDSLDEALWRHAERGGVTVVAVPVSREQMAEADTPLLRRAATRAVPLA